MGKNIITKHMKDLLQKHNITLYLTENEEKSIVCERWNHKNKTKMWKQFTVHGNTVYLDTLPKILKQHNNTKHSSIKMTPVEASKKKNESTVYFNLYGDMEQLSSKPRFKIGDKVRISKYKRKLFDKDTHLIGLVDKIQSTNPITYRLEDLNKEEDLAAVRHKQSLMKIYLKKVKEMDEDITLDDLLQVICADTTNDN